MTSLSESDIGARLYEIVEAYALIGAHHRTGTAEDARTLDWFEDRLRALGATTERQAWSFDQYEATWRVTIDGEDAAALPLFYEGTGMIESAKPFVAAVSAVPAGAFPEWPTIVANARLAGAPVAVVATRPPSGASSRRIARPLSLVQDCRRFWLRVRSRGGLVRHRCVLRSPRASPAPGRATSSRVSAPVRDHDRLMLTTPLSGWF